MLDILFFGGIVWYFSRQVAASPRRSGAGGMPARAQSPQLTQMLAYADRLFAERKFLACEKAYLRVLKLDHKNLLAYTRLGAIYAAQKNYPDAIECLLIATRLAPSGTNYYHLGQVYFDNQNYIKAIAAFEKSLAFESSAVRYQALARAYVKVASNQKAINCLLESAKLEPTPKLYLELAELQQATRDYAAARASYQQVIDLDPSNARARAALRKAVQSLEKISG